VDWISSVRVRQPRRFTASATAAQTAYARCKLPVGGKNATCWARCCCRTWPDLGAIHILRQLEYRTRPAVGRAVHPRCRQRIFQISQTVHRLIDSGLLLRSNGIGVGFWPVRKPRRPSWPGAAACFPQERSYVLADDARASGHRAEGNVLLSGFDTGDTLLR
jgi:hypothetical protein